MKGNVWKKPSRLSFNIRKASFIFLEECFIQVSAEVDYTLDGL